MHTLKVGIIWVQAFLLAVAMAGCCGSSNSTGTGNPSLTPPTVVSVIPTGASTGICQGAFVSATFSKAMNPATINTGTFTLAGASAVTGTVSLDAANLVATFTPSSPLALNTQYTATITTGA